MVNEAYKKILYRDPKHAIIGGVCAGIAERLDVDVLLVRVAAIVAFVMSLGIVSLVYLVLWTILPIKVAQGGFIDVEPSRVRSERFDKVVTLQDDTLKVEHADDEDEQDGPLPEPRSRRPKQDLAALRFPFVIFIALCIFVTPIGIVLAGVTKSNGFVSFLPLYLIPLGVFLALAFDSIRSAVIRWCIVILCVEACVVMLPFTMGVVNYESMAFQQATTFLIWLIAFVILVAALIFENSACYCLAVILVFVATVSLFNDFGFFSTMASYANIAS